MLLMLLLKKKEIDDIKEIEEEAEEVCIQRFTEWKVNHQRGGRRKKKEKREDRYEVFCFGGGEGRRRGMKCGRRAT